MSYNFFSHKYPAVKKAPDPGSPDHRQYCPESSILITSRIRPVILLNRIHNLAHKGRTETGFLQRGLDQDNARCGKRAGDHILLHLHGLRVPHCCGQGTVCSLAMSFPVLWSHDILVWIRIRIRGSMPLTNGSGSCYFCH